MKCHYEVLNIERDADDGDIKKAYKKQALKWHPDKNLDNPEAAKEQFQLVQQAYEVLIDPQERAFYDKHRDQILKGKNSDYEETCLDVFQYFTASCYKGYSDSESNNFYQVYSEVFAKIFAEDFEFMTEEEIEAVPEFGKSDSDYETVVKPFYNYADQYSTKKSYAWLFPHDISEARHRKVMKIIDKENKKIQLKARKERNEEVRSLVAFVKKRDKRVQAYKKLLEEKTELNRQKSHQKKIEQLRKLNDEVKEQTEKMGAILNEGYEEQLQQLEENYFDMYLNDDQNSESSHSDYEDLFCEACNRIFKDSQSYSTHLSTKKHRINEKILNSADVTPETKKADENCDVGENDTTEETVKPKKKANKKNKSRQAIVINEERTNGEDSNQVSDEDFDWSSNSKKGKKSKQKGQQNKSNNNDKVKLATNGESRVEEQTDQSVTEKERDDAPASHLCATCQNQFSSKNKLFDHLKKTNHSVYLPKTKTKK